MSNEKIFRKNKLWSPTWSDAIDGKKWVKVVAMPQNSATLIYDLNTMKGPVESYLKRIAEPFKRTHFQA